jgi:hypothetical protein
MARAQLRARTILETLGRSHEDLFRLKQMNFNSFMFEFDKLVGKLLVFSEPKRTRYSA